MPHDVKIPDYVIERIMAKRGKLSVFDSFDAAKIQGQASERYLELLGYRDDDELIHRDNLILL